MEELEKLPASEYKVINTPSQIKERRNTIVVQKTIDRSVMFILVIKVFMKRHFPEGIIFKSDKAGKIKITKKITITKAKLS